MNWDFFSDVYILNQQERIDRWLLCQRELARVGIENYSQFYSVPMDPPMKSFCFSQRELINTFLREGGDTLLALEDDCLFDNLSPLEAAIDQLPPDWDMLYLGGNLRGINPRPYSENLRIPQNPWQTHAIAYSRRGANKINYDPSTGQMFDDWLAEKIFQFKVFLVAPMVAWQRPGFSNIWGANTDYTETHKQGNALI